MFCKACDYPLWNLTSRTCPECGEAFKPSDFRFRPGSVVFLCPHCGQRYLGTDPKGHLYPSVFTCTRCANDVEMDEMVLLPTPGCEERSTKAETVPWLERGLKGGWATIWMSVASPVRMGRAIAETMPVGSLSVLLFGIITQSIFGALAFGVFMVFPLIGIAAGAGTGGPVGGIVLGVVTGLVALIAGTALWILAWAGSAHLLLRLTGGRPGAFYHTLAPISLAGGTNFLTGIPCVGFYLAPFGLLWWAITAGIMLHITQRANAWRAALAVGVFPLLAIGLVGAGVVWWFVWITNLSSQFSGLGAMGISNSLIYGSIARGSYPDHGAELLLQSNSVGPRDFYSDPAAVTPTDPFAGAYDLGAVESMTASAQSQAINQLATNLPADVIAHRVGDCIFTYHGVQPPSTAPTGVYTPARSGVWILVVESRSQQSMYSSGSGALYTAYAENGNSQSFDASRMQTELAAQNQIRAGLGLDPLPDLTTITHAQPAASGP